MIGMTTTKYYIPSELLKFAGQCKIEVWQVKNRIEQLGWDRHSQWLVDEVPLCLQSIRELADEFPFYQRKAKTGRPPMLERDLLIGFLVRSLFHSKYTATEALLHMFNPIFEMDRIPDSTTLSKKNNSKRWSHLWKRFHNFIMEKLPERKAIIATDATGLGSYQAAWSDTPYDVRARQNWVKLHAAIEVDAQFILSYELTDSNVHESQVFEPVWSQLPENVQPKASVADGGYADYWSATVAKELGATPYHSIREDAKLVSKPRGYYQKMVYHAKHFPNRFCEMLGKRSQVESAFAALKLLYGSRLKCRNDIARENEVQAKISAYNIRGLAQAAYLGS